MGKILEQQSKLAAAAQASADKHLTRAKDMRNKFTTYCDKRAGELRAVKQSAKKKVAAMEDANSKELERQRAKSFRDSRVDAKKIVHLEGQLEVQERKLTKDAVVTLNNLAIAHQHNINELQSSSLRKERATTKALQHSIRDVQSSSYREIKAIRKDKVSLEASLAAAIVEKEQAIAIKDVAVKEAVKEARTEERLQASSKVRALSSRLNDTKTMVYTVLEERRHAEREARRSSKDADQSAKRSKSVSEVADEHRLSLEQAEKENASLREALAEMQALVDEQERRLDNLDKAVPIKVVQKTHEGSKGRPRWGLDVWELIIEQLVNGTPPSAVNNNIISNVLKFSPTTIIKELPSIWTIRRARTVLLVIVQTLASYRLGKADKWGQLNHDATARRQISFENLVISIEEDELFQ